MSQLAFVEQIELQEPVCAREARGNVLHGMDEGWASPNKVRGFSGGLHQDSRCASDPLARAELCSQVTRFCGGGTGLGLPFGSWQVLLGEQTSVSCEGKRKRALPLPC